ncbi:MAG: D-alanine--D-alanine ligase [Planctomycetes bacterium ADurb.Bin126]|nr:MAG: D-alanine--D-alanine ligase [Planctomycetes bacterium ADurb.Bin126]HOD81548.1 GNAT family N-acetyltransferase [Phycisphaerae bacterium]HQL72952.1 GNAT family N-acetyltransferase [Phycisphaerae bacterium]
MTDNHPLPAVLILYNLPRETPVQPGPAACVGAESEAGVLGEVQAVEDALRAHGVPCRSVGARTIRDLPAILASASEGVVFNLVEGFQDCNDDANLVPALCRAFDKSPTGGDSPCLMLALDKWQSKAVLAAAHLPTPPAAVVCPGQSTVDAALPAGRCIVKPLRCDASEGIDAASVAECPSVELDAAVRRVHDTFGQPALIEQFFGRRELNVTVIERDGRAEVMPLAEIDFTALPDGYPPIVGYAEKWFPDSDEYRRTPRVIPAPLGEQAAARVRELALRAWHAFDCRDYIRIEFRLDEKLDPAILELNPNPDISPDAGLAAAVQAGGLAYDEFIVHMAANAAARARRAPAPASDGASQEPPYGGTTNARARGNVLIRWSEPADRQRILDFVQATGFFRDDEIPVAAEVLDDALAKGPAGHYQSLTAVNADSPDAAPVGWVCYGPTPCTIATYDIYWIAVAPDCQGRGIGAALLAEAERQIAERGGRLSIIETSGKPSYDPTRHFYLKTGYTQAARIADFYAPGDDKTVYAKRLI